ncbi:MAG: AMP-binding protein [Methylococcaceae bacterium]|nr:AMP-binding protein [Methylococcaceae bacterium]
MENVEATSSPAMAYWPAVKSEILAEQTIGGALKDSARTWPDRACLVEGTKDYQTRRRWTFQELLEDAEVVARALLSRFRQGEHITVWAPNCPEWVLIEFGAALAGLTLVTANPAYLSNELAYVLNQSKSAGILVWPEYRNKDMLSMVESIRAEVPLLREVISLGAWAKFLRPGLHPAALPVVKPDDTAQIQYTSGTTGFPKGALLTHRGLAANALLYARTIEAKQGDVWINPMPMFHTAGCGLATLGCLQTGGIHVLPYEFDTETFVELFESEKGNLTLCVPTMLLRVLDFPGLSSRDLSGWRIATLGGAPVPPELLKKAQSALGLKLSIGYGQTESSPYITHTLTDEPRNDWFVTVGRALPNIEVRIAEPESDSLVPMGVVGEIQTRSFCVMKGYFENPEATKAALSNDGWLRTGDLGSMDPDGYIRIQGRLKDMIIRGGENIYPREVEDVLFEHPAIASVTVVGVPDQEWGEAVCAFVQLRADMTADEDVLSLFCRQKLASYKTPRIWRFVSEFPQTASGKIQKFILRRQYLEEIAQKITSNPKPNLSNGLV